MATISIITITYNAEKYLERTLQSILGQDTHAFEYLIIDGNSTDGTLSLVEKYRKLLVSPIHFKLISEPDKGLYDAMNKGLRAATGDFVWFMNAGDEIAESDTLSKILSKIDNTSDVLFGETYFVNDSGQIRGLRSELTPHRLPEKLDWKQMRYGMLVCHQSFLVRRSIAPAYIENNLSADIDWEIKSLKNARKVVNLGFVVSKYLEGGISNKQLKRSLIDRYKILKYHFGLGGALQSHVVIALRGFGKIIRNKGKYW